MNPNNLHPAVNSIEKDRETELQDSKVLMPFQVGQVVEVKAIKIYRNSIHVQTNNNQKGIIYKRELEHWVNYPEELVDPGENLQAMVIHIPSKEKGRILLSRKRLFPSPLDSLEMGQVVDGTVLSIGKRIVWVRICDIIGSLPSSELSWEETDPDPNEYVYVGQVIRVKIIKINKKKERIEVSTRKVDDPWACSDYTVSQTNEVNTREGYDSWVSSNYTVSQTIEAPVIKKTKTGVFLDLGNGIRGFLHIAEMAWIKGDSKKMHLSLKIGNTVQTIIKSIDYENKWISLSVKKLQTNPYDAFIDEHPVGTSVNLRVIKYCHKCIIVRHHMLGDFKLPYPDTFIPTIEELKEKIPVNKKICVWVKSYEKENHRIAFDPDIVM